MSERYMPEQYVEDLRAISREARDEEEILSRVAPLAKKLVANRDWIEPKYLQADSEQGFGVHLLHEEDDHTLAVLVVAWDPGRGTPPHDHGTWAVVAGIEGDEKNIRYKRVDDGSREGHAQLAVKDEMTAGAGDVVCMKTGGIHAVWNETDAVSVSLHTYGKHVNYTDRSQFDLETGEQKRFIVKVS